MTSLLPRRTLKRNFSFRVLERVVKKCQHSVQYASRNLDSFAVLLHVKNVVHAFANIVQRKTYARGQYKKHSHWSNDLIG